MASLGPEERIILLDDAKEDAKQQFEADRDFVLASLSPRRKRTFNEIYLALRGESYAPALVKDLPVGLLADIFHDPQIQNRTIAH
jgi:hypothetical protein